MDEKIIDRLVYIEETYAGEIETWHDPMTDTYYHIPIAIYRIWSKAEKL